MTRATFILSSFGIAALTAGCHTASDDGDGAENDDSSDPEVVTYYEDVAPIVAARCYTCHREGGAGPFELETFEQVDPLGELIRDVTQARIMPPWLADSSGDCTTYHDSRWLTEEELEVIAEWVDDGKYPGNPDSMPEFQAEEEHIQSPTRLLEFEQAYTPEIEEDDDDYHCFVIDPELEQDMFLTSYEILPGDPKIVHHVLVYTPLSEDAVQEIYDADAADEGEGYTCFGGPETDDVILAAAWAPGRNVWSYPEGMGVPIKAGMPQVVQVHYHVEEGLAPDHTAVALEMTDSVDQELLPWFFANTELAIPPGQPNALTKFEMTTDVFMDEYEHPEWAEPMTLVGIGPHMHELGKSLNLEVAKADGTGDQCVVDVPRWDFNWQFAYFLENPVRIELDDLLRMHCTYDSTEQEEYTYWGDGTDEEMCLAVMYSVFDDGQIPEG